VKSPEYDIADVLDDVVYDVPLLGPVVDSEKPPNLDWVDERAALPDVENDAPVVEESVRLLSKCSSRDTLGKNLSL
jgi:hypothetical protein